MKFRKRPVIIEADIFQWGMEDGVQRYGERIPREADGYPKDMHSEAHPGYLSRHDDLLDDKGFEDDAWRPYIQTLEGPLFISEGDWIITGVNGERYACKPDIFEKTYDPA